MVLPVPDELASHPKAVRGLQYDYAYTDDVVLKHGGIFAVVHVKLNFPTAHE